MHVTNNGKSPWLRKAVFGGFGTSSELVNEEEDRGKSNGNGQ
jgi:hypothetical protein